MTDSLVVDDDFEKETSEEIQRQFHDNFRSNITVVVN